MSTPKFIHLTDRVLAQDDLRHLLSELHERRASDLTIELLGRLTLTQPAHRLAQNFSKTLVIMAERPIHTILEDGLWPDESFALVELDEKDFSLRSRATAHLLMNIKERWLLCKSVRGFFNKQRVSITSYLDV